MTDILTETVLTIAQAAREEPGAKGAAHASRYRLVRWATRGVRAGGVVVRLEAIRSGGNWVTSREALARFRAATTAAAGGPVAPARTPTERRRESEAAERALIAAGW